MTSGGAASKGWGQLSIQSKLLAMLLASSILTALVVGLVAYQSGTNALEDSALDRLTSLRESRGREIRNYFSTLQSAQVVYTGGSTAVDAVTAFSDAFNELGDSTVTSAQQDAVNAWYEDFFGPGLSANAGVAVDASGFLRMEPAERYLQATYVATQADYDEAISVDDAGDGSAWSAAHATYHDFFREIAVRLAYDDVLLFDTEGNVVYSAYKGFDLGANVRSGSLRGTSLADAYEAAMASGDIDYVELTDFERYPPPFGRPSMWTVSPSAVAGSCSARLPCSFHSGRSTTS